MEDVINSQNGDLNKIQVSVQRILSRVRNEDNDMDSSSPSIYMAPDVLRHLSPSSFDPRVVSIGPLHREDKNVQAFERQKGRYVLTLMDRLGSPPKEILESCLHRAYVLMDEIKASYVWTKTSYGDTEIAEMMVIDACFILEFLYQLDSKSESKSYLRSKFLAKNVCHDLVLLENQIPYFFLREIHQCTILTFDVDASLLHLIHTLLLSIDPFLEHRFIFKPEAPHILSILHESYQPLEHYMMSNFLRNPTIQSVVDLERAGVNFKPYRNLKWRIGMKVKLSGLLSFVGFWSKPTLKMPVLLVSDRTELVLRNLIAYEQSFETGNYITSYVIAMDSLVKTQEDVAKLVQSRVLVNSMGTNEEVANMIKNISKDGVMADFYYGDQWETLNRYWDTNIAWVRRTYFIGPWNIISLLAGIILFFLTVVQTIFTIKPFGSNN